jgi:hypothetical protein
VTKFPAQARHAAAALAAKNSPTAHTARPLHGDVFSSQRSIVLRAPESAQGERSSKFIGLPLTVFCEGFVIAMQRPRENWWSAP